MYNVSCETIKISIGKVDRCTNIPQFGSDLEDQAADVVDHSVNFHAPLFYSQSTSKQMHQVSKINKSAKHYMSCHSYLSMHGQKEQSLQDSPALK